MADVQIVLTIPDAKVTRVRTAIKKLYPVELNPDGTPKYTDMQWIKKLLTERIVQWVYMSEQQEAVKTAQEVVIADESVVN